MSELRIKQLRYEFTYPGEIFLHRDVPTITFRGAFGYALAQVIARQANVPEFSEQVALYKNIFSPCNDGDSNSRNHDLARPFVLRGWYNRPDRRSFILDVHLFGCATEYEHFFDTVIETISYMGIGKMNQVCRLNKIFSVMLDIREQPPDNFLKVKFISPCIRMKSDGELFLDEIPFYTLFARLADRLRELERLYEDGNTFSRDEELFELKHQAKMYLAKKLDGGHYQTIRHSGRTAQTMYLDGFLGTMGYCGDFIPYQKYLKYLPYINLGRFNVFGCGWCEMSYLKNII